MKHQVLETTKEILQKNNPESFMMSAGPNKIKMSSELMPKYNSQMMDDVDFSITNTNSNTGGTGSRINTAYSSKVNFAAGVC